MSQTLLSVAKAQAIVLEHAKPLPSHSVPLQPEALGLILAEDVASDLDLPPFDKSMMDGFALRSDDGTAERTIVEEITAGHMPTKRIGPGEASQIMTGAALPEGADAVVMIERCRLIDGGRVQINETPTPAQNVQPLGREMRKGEIVIPIGTALRPAHFGVLASVGRTTVGVIPPPRVSIMATGDELVEPDLTPGAGQIRNSNSSMLLAQTVQAGAVPRYLGIAGDDGSALSDRIKEGLEANILILSGGVSVGTHDLVPGVLRELNVEALFHKVALKPGKPILFGTRGDTLVFGLPGNPVSSFVGFELFVKLAILRLRGFPPCVAEPISLPLACDFRHRSDRPTYHPAKLDFGTMSELVHPVTWHGSPDLLGLSRADGLMVLPAGEFAYAAGDRVGVLRLFWSH